MRNSIKISLNLIHSHFFVFFLHQQYNFPQSTTFHLSPVTSFFLFLIFSLSVFALDRLIIYVFFAYTFLFRFLKNLSIFFLNYLKNCQRALLKKKTRRFLIIFFVFTTHTRAIYVRARDPRAAMRERDDTERRCCYEKSQFTTEKAI